MINPLLILTLKPIAYLYQAAGVWCKDGARAHRVANQLLVGTGAAT